MESGSSSINEIIDTIDLGDVDFGDRTSPDGTFTIVFSDIEGSTTLCERLGDDRWYEVLREHNAIVRRLVRDHGGTEVKAVGDGFMLAFSSSRGALGCAIGVQRAFAHWATEHEHPMRIRIGMNAGFMIQEGPDFFGRNVIMAARITDAAAGGEILVSDTLREYVEHSRRFEFAEPREVELRGLSGTHRVHPVVWMRDDGSDEA